MTWVRSGPRVLGLEVPESFVDDRELRRFDLPKLMDQIKEVKEKIDELTAALEGKQPRKALGIVPRDW